MLAGDMVALYCQGEMYGRVPDSITNIDYTKIYTTGSISYAFLKSDKGKPQTLYLGGAKFAKSTKVVRSYQVDYKIRRIIEANFSDGQTWAHPNFRQEQQVWWRTTRYELDNGTTLDDEWKVVLGNPNFARVVFPSYDGYRTPDPAPAMYADIHTQQEIVYHDDYYPY